MSIRNLTRNITFLVALSADCMLGHGLHASTHSHHLASELAKGLHFKTIVREGVQSARELNFPTMNLHVSAGSFVKGELGKALATGQYLAGSYAVAIGILDPQDSEAIVAVYPGVGYCNPARKAIERTMDFGDGISDEQIFEIHAYGMTNGKHGTYGSEIGVRILSGLISPHLNLSDLDAIKQKIQDDKVRSCDWFFDRYGITCIEAVTAAPIAAAQTLRRTGDTSGSVTSAPVDTRPKL